MNSHNIRHASTNTNAYWQGKRVFITGVGGLLGSWLSRALVERGALVVGLVYQHHPNSLLTRSGMDKKITLRMGDLRDEKALVEIVRSEKPEIVFHIGAQAMIDTARESPRATFETNIAGTWNVLEACRELPHLNAVIIASSEKAYGNFPDLKTYDESTPLAGQDPYGASKGAADIIAQSYFHAYGLPVAITRCGNFFGGGDLNFRRIVPSTIRAALFNEELKISSAAHVVRDCFYIEDAVSAYLTLAEQMDDSRVHGHAFNFGAGTPFTVLNLSRRILLLMESNIEPIVLDSTPPQVLPVPLGLKKARQMLGWQPKWSFEGGMLETIKWYREFFGKSSMMR